MIEQILQGRFGFVIMFAVFGFLLYVGGEIIERRERREQQIDESIDRHPSAGRQLR